MRNILLGVLFLTLGSSARAKVPNALEPDFAEAIIAFNKKQLSDALRRTDSLITLQPEQTEFLELRALIFKGMGQPKKSEQVYAELIRIQKAKGADMKTVAPYYFELGLLTYKDKRLGAAEKLFSLARSAGFNPEGSAFFLGMIALQNSSDRRARQYFEEVVASGHRELTPPARLLLSSIYLKMKHVSGAVTELTKARDDAQAVLRDGNATIENKKIAGEIEASALRSLEPLDRSKFFGSASLLLGYDSNVRTLPDTTVDSEATGKTTGKADISLALGWMSSPLRRLQFVPSYNASTNFNSSRLDGSKQAQYFNQTGSLYLTAFPSRPLNGGMKVESTSVFQYKPKDSSTNADYKYEAYSYSYGGGAFGKWDFRPGVSFTIDGSVAHTYYPADKKLSADLSKRTGLQSTIRIAIDHDSGTRFINPKFSLSYTDQNPYKGKTYRTKKYGLRFANQLHLPHTIDLLIGFEVQWSRFPEQTDIKREDQTYTLSLAPSYPFSERLTMIGDFKFTSNESNKVTTYQYQRWEAMVGASFSFL